MTQELKVIDTQWRFGMHLPVGPEGQDLHFVKEVQVMEDKSVRPNMRIIPEFERPIWVTKPQFRTHTDKKEYEKLTKLDMHMVTQSKLRNKVALLTGRSHSQAQLSELLASPFVYAGDVPSVTLLNRELYRKKRNPEVADVPYKVGAFDTETDVLYGTGEIIIGSMTIWPEVHLVIRSDWLGYDNSDLDDRIRRVMNEKLKPVLDNFFEKIKVKYADRYPVTEMKLSYEIVPDEISIVEKSFKWFHERKPDWMAIWNIDFDITKIMEACARADVDPKQILCDPGFPYEYRICRYKRGQTFKVAASGKGKPVSPHDQWHVLFLTASFYAIDSMSAYRLMRLGEQEERSYSLDAILEKEFGPILQKLKHAPADMYVKEKWHQVMQRDYKFEYLAYAAMDTIAMCLLDAKTRDLSHRFPAMADITDFSQANSQPKRLRDAFFEFALDEHQHVIGSVGFTREAKKQEEEKVDLGDVDEYGPPVSDDDLDDEEAPTTLGRKGWVLTLASHFSAFGLKLINGCKNILTGIRAFVYDSDAVSSYPSCTQVANASKVTTRKEPCSIEGKEERLFRLQNLNLIAAPETNAIEYTTKMFDAPTLLEWLDMYDIAEQETK
jgi:hypothetical protein